MTKTPSTATSGVFNQYPTDIVLETPATAQVLLTLIRQKRLTDAIDWLETHGITGETAVKFSSSQGGDS